MNDVKVYDLGGQDRFSCMFKDYLNPEKGVIRDPALIAIVVDGSVENSRAETIKYLTEKTELMTYLSKISEYSSVAILESKTDLPSASQSLTMEDMIQEVTTSLGKESSDPVTYFKYSAKDGSNIEAIKLIMKYAVDKKIGDENRDNSNLDCVFSGVGSSGKTTLAEKLRTGEFNEKIKLTIGYDFTTIPYEKLKPKL